MYFYYGFISIAIAVRSYLALLLLLLLWPTSATQARAARVDWESAQLVAIL